MPTCSQCRKEIDHLNYYQNRRIGCSFTLTGNKQPGYYEWDNDFELADPDTEYSCPECCEVVCTTEEDAVKILKGEQIE